jgi:uncharacterized delta-60 repeat protein
MTLTRWLCSFLNAQPAVRKQLARRLALEYLEARENPSGGLLDPTFGVGGVVHLPTTTDGVPLAVAVQPDGKAVVVGQIARPHSSSATSITVQRLNPDGSLDATFNKTGSLTIQTAKSDWPTSVALQPDGKILVGGFGGGALVARVNPNGTMDATFGSNGVWISTAAGTVQKLAVLTDATHTAVTGIVAAAGGTANGQAAFEAIKLTPAGQPDKTFGSGGYAVMTGVAGSLEGMTVSPTGEIYMVGATDVTRADGKLVAVGAIEAVTPAGAPDAAFGGGTGYVLADPTGTRGSHFYDAALQTLTVGGLPTTRLAVAGSSWNPDNSQSYGIVSRYATDGTLDTTFGQAGTFTTATADPLDKTFFRSVALQADGSVVVGGYQNYTAGDGTTRSEVLLGHLTADGAADTTFGAAGTGFFLLQDYYASTVKGIAIDPTTGDILVVGTDTAPGGRPTESLIARFTA